MRLPSHQPSVPIDPVFYEMCLGDLDVIKHAAAENATLLGSQIGEMQRLLGEAIVLDRAADVRRLAGLVFDFGRACFECAAQDDAVVEVVIEGETLTAPATGISSSAHATHWMTTVGAGLALGVGQGLRSLLAYPTERLLQSPTQAVEGSEHLVEAMRSLAAGTDAWHDAVRECVSMWSAHEGALSPIGENVALCRLILALERGEGAFEDALVAAVTLRRARWQGELRDDTRGLFAPRMAGVVAVARDSGYALTSETPYIPGNLRA